MPGTGKTATCLEVVRRLQRAARRDELPAFRFVEINGLSLASPYHAYTKLYEALTGCHAPPQRAAELLEAMFSKGGPAASKVRPADNNDTIANHTNPRILVF